MISVERLPDVDAFLAAAGPFLAEREAEHNLLLGIASNLQAGLVPASSEPNDFFVCRAAGSVHAADVTRDGVAEGTQELAERAVEVEAVTTATLMCHARE